MERAMFFITVLFVVGIISVAGYQQEEGVASDKELCNQRVANLQVRCDEAIIHQRESIHNDHQRTLDEAREDGIRKAKVWSDLLAKKQEVLDNLRQEVFGLEKRMNKIAARRLGHHVCGSYNLHDHCNLFFAFPVDSVVDSNDGKVVTVSIVKTMSFTPNQPNECAGLWVFRPGLDGEPIRLQELSCGKKLACVSRCIDPGGTCEFACEVEFVCSDEGGCDVFGRESLLLAMYNRDEVKRLKKADLSPPVGEEVEVGVQPSEGATANVAPEPKKDKSEAAHVSGPWGEAGEPTIR